MVRRTATTCGIVLAAALAVTLPAGARAASPGVPGRAGPRPPAPFVTLSSVDPTIRQDIRYATPHNFTGRVVDGYTRPVCLLTAPAALALHRAQQRLLRRGHSLKV